MNDTKASFDLKRLGSAIYDSLSPDADGDRSRFSLHSIPFGNRIAEFLSSWSWQIELIFVAAVTLAAFWLRFYDIESFPLGMHGDEANYGLDAKRFLSGEYRGFWTGSNLGNPAGFSWWVGALFMIGDSNLTWLRMSSVLAGAATIPVSYALVRQVLGRQIAIPAIVLITTSSWLIIQSRVAFPMMLSVLIVLLSVYLLVESVKRHNLIFAALGGIVFGSGVYSYKAFAIFFFAVSATLLILTYLPSNLRRRKEPYLFLLTSIAVAAPLLIFYFESGYLTDNFAAQYLGTSNLSVSTMMSRIFEVPLFVKNPISEGGIDGLGAVPLLNVFAQLAFFAGLATLLIFIRWRPYQLLVVGFLIAMAPAVMVPGAESRRFLLGIVFVLIVVSIGIRTIVIVAWTTISKLLEDTTEGKSGPSRSHERWVLPIVVVAIAAAFFPIYTHHNSQHLNDWRNSTWGLDWYFETDFIAAMKFVDELDDNYQMVLYSGRRSFNDQRRAFLYPDLVGFDGAAEHGGSGSIPNHLDNRQTAFILMGDYIELGDQIKDLYPNSRRIEQYADREKDPHNTLLYVAYLVGEG